MPDILTALKDGGSPCEVNARRIAWNCLNTTHNSIGAEPDMEAITDDHKKALRDVMRQQDGLATRKKEISESISAVAKELGLSSTRVNKLIVLVRKERVEMGTIGLETELLDAAKEIAR